jgi:hypothetical protein
METMVHPAAWRCGYYLSSGVDSTKRQIFLIFLKNKSNIPVDNGSSLNRTPAMAPILGPLFWVLFLGGHISLKNRS